MASDTRIPVDKGWAWMVLAGSFMISTINTGTEKSYGIFFIEFLRMFKGTVFMTVLINTVLNVAYCITAASVLLIGFKKMEIRMSVFLGIILCSIGYGISSLATGLEFLLASQSILIGIGIGFHNPPIYILLGEYFDKRKGLANAIFLSANALGGIVMPPLYRYVFDEYGLRGGLVITAGITLNSLVAAALLRPSEFYTKNGPKTFNTDKDVSLTKPNNSENNFEECDSGTLYPLLSKETEKQSSSSLTRQIDETNDMFDRLSNSNVVRYSSNGDVLAASLASLGSNIDQHEDTTCKGKCDGGFLVKCRQSIDCYLMKNVLFLLFLAIYCFGNVAIMCAHIYVPKYAEDIGIDDQRISVIVSITCLSDFLGRILAGFLADQSWITPQQIVILSQVVVGIVLQFTVYFTSFWTLVVFVMIFGSTGGMIVALFPPILIKIVGKERYRSAIAVFIICISLFEGLALPLLGYIRDVTETFHLTFHIMGASSFITAILLIIFDVLTRRKAKLKTESDEDANSNH